MFFKSVGLWPIGNDKTGPSLHRVYHWNKHYEYLQAQKYLIIKLNFKSPPWYIIYLNQNERNLQHGFLPFSFLF